MEINLKQIPEITLIRSDAGAKNFRFLARGSDVGNRNKLGGEPDGDGDSGFPVCSLCAKRMFFYGQLDSVNDKWMLMDCALIHVYMCFECMNPVAVIRSVKSK